MLQFGGGEERVGTHVALLCLDREIIRQRGGASRHLERSELAFNIEGDNPGPTSEADIANSRWDWGSRFEDGCWKMGSTTREQMRGGEEKGRWEHKREERLKTGNDSIENQSFSRKGIKPWTLKQQPESAAGTTFITHQTPIRKEDLNHGTSGRLSKYPIRLN